jgi:mRNA-degrading endonuclease RelE of RelBE toxin-antitoxin system
LGVALIKNPIAGIPLGAGLYKIRLASSDMTKGKSGAFRIIYYLWLEIDTIVLLDLYSKGEKEDVPVSELKKILADFLSK